LEKGNFGGKKINFAKKVIRSLIDAARHKFSNLERKTVKIQKLKIDHSKSIRAPKQSIQIDYILTEKISYGCNVFLKKCTLLCQAKIM
jgi:hypothetical protein